MTKPITDAELAEFDKLMSDEDYTLEPSAEYLVLVIRERLRLADQIVSVADRFDDCLAEFAFPTDGACACAEHGEALQNKIVAYRAAIKGDKRWPRL